MPSVVFSLPAGADITPRNGMKFLAEQVKNGVVQPNCVICMLPGTPDYLGLVIEATETTTPPHAPTGGTATFDILITNDVGVTLSTLVLHASHDGGGSLSSPTMPTSLDVGANATVSLTYTTNLDLTDVTLTVYVTGTKPDTTTATSNTLLLTVATDPEWVDPESPPP